MTNNELLRTLVPGVKAEYEVKNITFPNLIAFLVAKAVNETVGYMIIDYEKIFEDCNISLFSCDSDDYKYLEIGIEYTIESSIKSIDSAIIYDIFGNFNLSKANINISYIINSISSIINKYWTNNGINFIRDNGFATDFILSISLLSNYDNIDNCKEFISNKNLLISKIPELVNEIMKHVLDVNGKSIVSQQQNSITNVSTIIPPFQPVEQVAISTPKVDLVGWSDIKPGIMDTEQPVHQPTGDPKYDQLSEQDKTIVDGFVGMMMDVNKMKQNPHAFEAQVNELRAAFNQATSNSQQQTSQSTVNIDVTKAPDGCSCGHEHCNCGNH